MPQNTLKEPHFSIILTPTDMGKKIKGNGAMAFTIN